MKTSNPHKTNINFSYVMQHTNELIGNDSLQPNNFMTLRSHTSPTPKPPIICTTRQQSLLSPLRITLKSTEQHKELQQMEVIEYTPEVKIERMQEIVGETWATKEKSKEKGQEKFKTPRKTKKKEGYQPPTTVSKDVRDDYGDQIKGVFNRKGLALISSLILEVLESQYKEKKRFTCGQISSKVLTQFCKTADEDPNKANVQDKEKRTIKRRVYDSINVLIALGKIKKEKKWLYMESIDQKIGEEILVAKRAVANNLDIEYQRKLETLKRVKAEYQKLVALKARNEKLEEVRDAKMESTMSTQALREQQHSVYRFPLLLVYTSKQHRMQIHIQKEPKSKQAEWNQRVIIQGQPLYCLSDMSSLGYLTLKQKKEKSKQRSKAR